ncbi:hypothetical protein Q670_00395 [Alcanivorax sp. P2S70]|nr:hypothetical protein Q670_00395 [Alcanivorax sp. P2S70]
MGDDQPIATAFFPCTQICRRSYRFSDGALACPLFDHPGQGHMAGGNKIDRKVTKTIWVVRFHGSDALFLEAASSTDHGRGIRPQQLCAGQLCDQSAVHGVIKMRVQHRDGVQCCDPRFLQCRLNTIFIGFDSSKQLRNANAGEVSVCQEVIAAIANQNGACAKIGD